MKPLYSIQYLRAFAALAVVVYHACQWRAGGFEIGRAGVDVFFVISGVIMWQVTRKNPTPGAFLWRRLTRVAPLYWLITLIVATVAVLWPAFLPNVHPGWGHLGLSLAFIPHLDPRGLPFPMLPPGWTLDYEAIFYLVFAGALLAPRRVRAVVVACALLAIAIFGTVVFQPDYYLGANPMLLQFAGGVILADLAERTGLGGPRAGLILIITGLSGFAIPAALGLFNELWRPLIWGAPALLLVAGCLSFESAGVIPRCALLERLGDASYALYLVHLPVTALVAHTVGVANPWLFYPATISASLLAGLTCHLWIERPLIARLRGDLHRLALSDACVQSIGRPVS